VVLPPLVAGSLTVAPAAVAVHGAGSRWAGFLSRLLPLGWPAAVARRRAEEVEDADSNFHVGALITVGTLTQTVILKLEPPLFTNVYFFLFSTGGINFFQFFYRRYNFFLLFLQAV
jgi:hypothetical protein